MAVGEVEEMRMKILLAMLMLVFLAGSVSAFGFDNVKSYDVQDKRVSIKNAFGFGDEIATAKLETPLVYDVPIGSNIKVAEFTVNSKEDYANAIKSVKFYDTNNDMEQVSRPIQWKVKSVKAETITDKNGTHTRYTEEWKEFDDSLKFENMTIGLFTTVYPRDRIEWIPTLFDVEVSEWAVYVGVLESTTFTQEGTDAGQTGVRGVSYFVGGQTIIFNNATKVAGTTFTGVAIVDNSTMLWVQNSTYTLNSNTTALLNWTGLPNRKYHIVAYMYSGGSGTVSWRNFNPYNVSGTYGNFTNSINNNFQVATNNMWVFTSLGVTGVGDITAVTITNPAANNTFYSSVANQNFNASATMVDSSKTAVNATIFHYAANGALIGTNFTTAVANNQTNFSIPNLGDGTRMFNIQFCSNNAYCLFALNNVTYTVDSNAPVVGGNQPINNSQIYSANSSHAVFPINISASDAGGISAVWYNSTWNSTPTFLTNNQLANVTAVNVFGLQRIFKFANDTAGNLVMNATTITIHRAYWQNNSFETENQTYALELWNETTVPSGGVFNYNGQNYTVDIAALANGLYQMNYTIDTPVNVNPVPFNWFYTTDQFRSSSIYQQTTNQTVFGICNTTLVTPYLNISFKNETTSQQTVRATASFDLTYYIGSGAVNKSYTFSNATENLNYVFCMLPSFKRVNTVGEITYENSVSLSRTTAMSFNGLTNVTTNKTYYLLPTILGIYSRYQTITVTGGVVQGAYGSVTRTLGGVPTLIAEGFTDSSGLLVFFLDPTASYDYFFNKDGVGSTTFSLVPNSPDTYTVTLGGSGGQIINGSTLPINMSYQILPSNATLQNSTLYTFSFNVTSSAVTYISMNLTNSTGHQLGFISNNGQGVISIPLNTGNNTRIFGSFIIQTSSETFVLAQSWIVYNNFQGDYSLFRQLDLFNGYGFQDFNKVILALVVILLIVAALSVNEVIDTSESKIMVAVILIWIFSMVGWFNTGFAIGTTNPAAVFANKYGIAILSSVIAAWFIGRRVAT